MTDFDPARAERFTPVDEAVVERWRGISRPGDGMFPSLLGLEVVDVRTDYCRMRLPFRDELLQAGGVVHGGGMASLLDAVVVPAVAAAVERIERAGRGRDAVCSTVDLHVQYLRAMLGGDRAEDAVAEGWVSRRGRRTVFCESEMFAATTGRLVAKSVLTYAVSDPGTVSDPGA